MYKHQCCSVCHTTPDERLQPTLAFLTNLKNVNSCLVFYLSLLKEEPNKHLSWMSVLSMSFCNINLNLQHIKQHVTLTLNPPANVTLFMTCKLLHSVALFTWVQFPCTHSDVAQAAVSQTRTSPWPSWVAKPGPTITRFTWVTLYLLPSIFTLKSILLFFTAMVMWYLKRWVYY